MAAEISFGKLIKRRRAALGMSQAALADLVGRSASAIRTWERGASTPTDEAVVRSLAAVLGVDESELRMTVGMPAEIRSEEPDEIGGRGLVEFTEERSLREDAPATSAAMDHLVDGESADEANAVTSLPPSGGDDQSIGAEDEVSWDDVAASVARHPEPTPPPSGTSADGDMPEWMAPADDRDDPDRLGIDVEVAEEAAKTEPATAAEPELDSTGGVPDPGVEEPEARDRSLSAALVTEEASQTESAAVAETVAHAEVGETGGVPEVDVEEGVGGGAGEPDTQADQPKIGLPAGDVDAAAEEGELEETALDPDAPSPELDTGLETLSVEPADPPGPLSPEPLAPAATAATRTTVLPVRAPVAPSAAGSYLDDPDQMITYWIRAALTVALVMFLLVVLFWALGKLGDSIGEVWALFKAGS